MFLAIFFIVNFKMRYCSYLLQAIRQYSANLTSCFGQPLGQTNLIICWQSVQQGKKQKCPHEVPPATGRRAKEVQTGVSLGGSVRGQCQRPAGGEFRAPPLDSRTTLTVRLDQYCSNNTSPLQLPQSCIFLLIQIQRVFL